MRFSHRIRTVYRKELIDILRDHRTLLAMILVPIVLYPLLMLGSVQAVSYQAVSLEKEKFDIGTIGEAQAQLIRDFIDADSRARDTARAREEAAAKEPAPSKPPEKLISQFAEAADLAPDQYVVRWFDTRENLERAIREREIHAGLILKGDRIINDFGFTNEVELLVDWGEVRGTFLGKSIKEMFERTGDRITTRRKAGVGLPEQFDQPFEVTYTDLSAPSSIMGQILPLILILMTITGAIYPAIDLTAGERERGTLESLMVCPVPVIDLVVGKFLVITTVAIMGATLNLASVTATVYFGGFDTMISQSGGPVPLWTMLFILLSLIPFAVLMSAIMIAVCSFARTFKEAQNYVTPVILAVLIPGGVAALPATRMEGIMLVMPVGNMVLLTRDLLLGATVPAWDAVLVLFSTSLYAAAAVALATKVFGQESVVFADAGSLSSTFDRKRIKPSAAPGLSLSLMIASLLFPAWFYVQSALSPRGDQNATGLLFGTAWLMPLFFLILPIAVLIYWKVDLRGAMSLRIPAPRFVLAALLLGISLWVPAHELSVLQSAFMETPEAFKKSAKMITDTLADLPPLTVIFILAVIPAVCEELFFRGLLLSGLSASMRKWTAIGLSAVVFGLFHFMLIKFAVTATLGFLLGYLCWQSRSIFPGMIVHLLHNGLQVLSLFYPNWYKFLGISESQDVAHLPPWIIAGGVALCLVGIFLASRRTSEVSPVTLPNFSPLPPIEAPAAQE